MADMQSGPTAADMMAGSGATSESQNRAIQMLDEAEKRIDELLDTAEKLFNRGAGYSERARTWVSEHHDYKNKAEQIISKAGQYRDKLRARQSEAGAGGEGGFASMKAAGRERIGDLGSRARSGVMGAGSFVRENPADAILIGAAVGVLVGTAFKHLRAESAAETPEGGTTYGV